MTNPRKLLIWGAGGHAMVVADIVRENGEYEVVGFLDDMDPDRWGSSFCGASVLGGSEQLDELRQEGVSAVTVAVGRSDARARLGDLVRAKGFELVSAVHPRAVVPGNVNVGAGTVIKGGAVIDPCVEIGENVIIGSCTSVGHHSVIEDAARINASVAISGHVRIGAQAMVGAGARIRDRVRIGAHSVIGLGSVVVGDIPDDVVAFGVPARVRKSRAPGDF